MVTHRTRAAVERLQPIKRIVRDHKGPGSYHGDHRTPTDNRQYNCYPPHDSTSRPSTEQPLAVAKSQSATTLQISRIRLGCADAIFHHGRLLAVVAGSFAAVILGGDEIARLIAFAVANLTRRTGAAFRACPAPDRFFPCCSQCQLSGKSTTSVRCNRGKSRGC